jgi:hypothetical protein
VRPSQQTLRLLPSTPPVKIMKLQTLLALSGAVLFAALPSLATAHEPVPLPLHPDELGVHSHAMAPVGGPGAALQASLRFADRSAMDSAPTADAPTTELAQYFPDDKQRAADPAGYADLPQYGGYWVPPVRFGIAMHLGGSVPRNELRGINADEFRGTFDIGGGLHFNIMRLVSFDLAVRGGFGGLNTSLYERRYRIPELNARHFHAGAHVRVHPFALGPLQPFISGAAGVNRVMAVRYEETGALICDDYGTWGRCEPETQRTFAAGYWGSTWGLGAGVLFDPGPDVPITLSFEVMRNYTTYGRYTVTGQRSIDLGNLSPNVASTTFLFAFNFLFF